MLLDGAADGRVVAPMGFDRLHAPARIGAGVVLQQADDPGREPRPGPGAELVVVLAAAALAVNVLRSSTGQEDDLGEAQRAARSTATRGGRARSPPSTARRAGRRAPRFARMRGQAPDPTVSLTIATTTDSSGSRVIRPIVEHTSLDLQERIARGRT